MSKADVEGQSVMFPELDSSPEHKAIFRVAKKLAKIRADRKEALTESKAEEDKTQEDLVGKMHTAGLESFKHGGIEVKIKPRSEKVSVKVGTEDDDDDSEEE